MTDETASVQGEGDDAIHLRDPDDSSRTLCGQYAPGVLNVVPVDEPPDGWGGCWTCLQAAPTKPEPTVPAPSDEARKAVAQVVHETWCDNCKICSGLHEDDYIAADVALAAIDLPRLLAEARAEGETARTAEIVAWLRERGEPQTLGRWMDEQTADPLAAHFNPEVEPKRPRNHAE